MVLISDLWMWGPAFHVDALGFIPNYVTNREIEPLQEQINKKYSFGGGWKKMDGWRINKPNTATDYPEIVYPASEPGEQEERYRCVAAFFHAHTNAMFFVFEGAWCAIVDGNDWDKFEISRID